jgi:hypothetical protein
MALPPLYMVIYNKILIYKKVCRGLVPANNPHPHLLQAVGSGDYSRNFLLMILVRFPLLYKFIISG